MPLPSLLAAPSCASEGPLVGTALLSLASCLLSNWGWNACFEASFAGDPDLSREEPGLARIVIGTCGSLAFAFAFGWRAGEGDDADLSRDALPCVWRPPVRCMICFADETGASLALGSLGPLEDRVLGTLAGDCGLGMGACCCFGSGSDRRAWTVSGTCAGDRAGGATVESCVGIAGECCDGLFALKLTGKDLVISFKVGRLSCNAAGRSTNSSGAGDTMACSERGSCCTCAGSGAGEDLNKPSSAL